MADLALNGLRCLLRVHPRGHRAPAPERSGAYAGGIIEKKKAAMGPGCPLLPGAAAAPIA